MCSCLGCYYDAQLRRARVLQTTSVAMSNWSRNQHARHGGHRVVHFDEYNHFDTEPCIVNTLGVYPERHSDA